MIQAEDHETYEKGESVAEKKCSVASLNEDGVGGLQGLWRRPWPERKNKITENGYLQLYLDNNFRLPGVNEVRVRVRDRGTLN